MIFQSVYFLDVKSLFPLFRPAEVGQRVVWLMVVELGFPVCKCLRGYKN